MSLDEMAAQIATPEYVQARVTTCEQGIQAGEMAAWISLAVLVACAIACIVAYVLGKKTRFEPDMVYGICGLVAMFAVFGLVGGISTSFTCSTDLVWWQTDPVTKVMKSLANAL